MLVFIVPWSAADSWNGSLPACRWAVACCLAGSDCFSCGALLSDSSDWTAVLPGLLIAGLGIGFANPAIGRIARRVVLMHRSRMASGISNTFRVAGLSCGLATLGAIVEQRVAGSLTDSLGVVQGGVAARSGRIAVRGPGSGCNGPDGEK